jgi:hypothetical protein
MALLSDVQASDYLSEILALSPGASNITGGTNLIASDNDSLSLGTGEDVTMVHDGTDTLISTGTGDFTIDNTNATGSTIFILGTTTSATDFLVQSNTPATLFSIDGAGAADFTTGNVDLSGGNDLLFSGNGDIGTVAGGDRPTNVYVATQVVVGSTVTIDADSVVGSGALTVNADVDSALQIGTSASATASGGALNIYTAAGTSGGSGGGITVAAGGGGATGTGGAISITTGAGGATSGDSGALTLDTGAAAGSGSPGDINVGTTNASNINMGNGSNIVALTSGTYITIAHATNTLMTLDNGSITFATETFNAAGTAMDITAGQGGGTLSGGSNPGLGGELNFSGGTGGATAIASDTAGTGGAVTLAGGTGGTQSVGAGGTGGTGGALYLRAGAGGSGTSNAGSSGNLFLGDTNTRRVYAGWDGSAAAPDADNEGFLAVKNISGVPISSSPSVAGSLAYDSNSNHFYVKISSTWTRMATFAEVEAADTWSEVLANGNTTDGTGTNDPTVVDDDSLVFGTDADGSIQWEASATSLPVAATVLLGATGTGTGAGTAVGLRGGTGGSTAGTGAAVGVYGGIGGAGGGDGGAAAVYGGAGTGASADGGGIVLFGGNAGTSGTGGGVQIGGGTSSTSGAGGNVTIQGGNGTGDVGGNTRIRGGNGSTEGTLELGDTTTSAINFGVGTHIGDSTLHYMGVDDDVVLGYNDSANAGIFYGGPGWTGSSPDTSTTPSLMILLGGYAAELSSVAVTGGEAQVTGGVGSPAVADAGGTGGAGRVAGGNGGDGTAALAAGTGGLASVRAGSGGTEGGGGGGGAGGDVDIDAGAGTGSEAAGEINIGWISGADRATAAINLGNSTDNTTITQSGSGQVTFTGNVDADAGLDVDGGDLTVAATYDLTFASQADGAGNGFLHVGQITGITGGNDPTAAPSDGALAYDAANDILYLRQASVWVKVNTETTDTDSWAATLAVGASSGGTNPVISDTDFLLAETDGGFDIGSADGGTTPLRPDTIYVKTDVIIGDTTNYADESITVDAAANNVTANTFTFTAGAGGPGDGTADAGDGGALDITAGAGGFANYSGTPYQAGTGGAISIVAGAAGSFTAGSTGANGGAITIAGGGGTGTSTAGGSVAIRGGNSTGTSSSGGSVTVRAGEGNGAATDGTLGLGDQNTSKVSIGANVMSDYIELLGETRFAGGSAAAPSLADYNAGTSGFYWSNVGSGELSFSVLGSQHYVWSSSNYGPSTSEDADITSGTATAKWKAVMADGITNGGYRVYEGGQDTDYLQMWYYLSNAYLEFGGADASSTGANIQITAQQGAATSAGGQLFLRGGEGGATSGNGGQITIEGGDSTSGTGGALVLKGGDATTGTGGDVTIYGGDGSSTDGDINIAQQSTAAINWGNASNNTTLTQTGNGQVTFTGNVDADAGLDIPTDATALTLGAGADLSLEHDGTHNRIESITGDLFIDNQSATGSTLMVLGSDDANTDFQVMNNSLSALLTVDGSGVVTAAGEVSVDYLTVPERASGAPSFVATECNIWSEPTNTSLDADIFLQVDDNGSLAEIQLTAHGGLNIGEANWIKEELNRTWTAGPPGSDTNGAGGTSFTLNDGTKTPSNTQALRIYRNGVLLQEIPSGDTFSSTYGEEQYKVSGTTVTTGGSLGVTERLTAVYVY